MAAMVTAAPANSVNNVASTETEANEDEKFLYGENKEPAVDTKDGAGEEKTEKMNGEVDVKEEEDDEGEFEDSDDDEDDINVHIGEVNASSQYGTPYKKDGTTAATAAAKGATPAAAVPVQGMKKIDVNAVGVINGQPIYEFDIDADQDEKPWRKPGADISDYFNYGFTEDTWKQYCEKQRRMRMESARTPYTVANVTASVPAAASAVASSLPPTQQIEVEVMPDGRTRVKAGPPPDRKVEGAIHVLGSDDARRKQKEEELLALALGPSRMVAPAAFPQQRIYSAIPQGGVMYNTLGQIPPGSQPDLTGQAGEALTTSQGQQIQSIGASSIMSGGLHYIPAGQPPIGGVHIAPGGAPIFPPPNLGMDMGQDHFMQPSGLPPPFGFPRGGGGGGGNSDSEFDSDGERKHRRRGESSRHRRHRDRSDRDRDRERSSRDRDRDRSRTDRDRSSSKRRHESRSSSDRKKHSSRSSRGEEDEEKKAKRKMKAEVKEEPAEVPPESIEEAAAES